MEQASHWVCWPDPSLTLPPTGSALARDPSIISPPRVNSLAFRPPFKISNYLPRPLELEEECGMRGDVWRRP